MHVYYVAPNRVQNVGQGIYKCQLVLRLVSFAVLTLSSAAQETPEGTLEIRRHLSYS
jgi:hypothetical protein